MVHISAASRTAVLWVCLFATGGQWALVTGAKTCYTMVVSGARWNSEVDGYYQLALGSCNGRDRYIQVNSTTYPGLNITEPYYIYHSWLSIFQVGWIIGKSPCDGHRSDVAAYVWNLNQRPDRVTMDWNENEYSWWERNRNLQVRCTEGMAYGAMLGTIFGCILGVPIIVTAIVLIVQKCSHKKVENRRPSNVDRTIQSIQQDNPTFEGESLGDLPVGLNYVMAPPTYQEALTEEDPASSANGAQGGVVEGEKPPSYVTIYGANGTSTQNVDDPAQTTPAGYKIDGPGINNPSW